MREGKEERKRGEQGRGGSREERETGKKGERGREGTQRRSMGGRGGLDSKRRLERRGCSGLSMRAIAAIMRQVLFARHTPPGTRLLDAGPHGPGLLILGARCQPLLGLGGRQGALQLRQRAGLTRTHMDRKGKAERGRE